MRTSSLFDETAIFLNLLCNRTDKGGLS